MAALLEKRSSLYPTPPTWYEKRFSEMLESVRDSD
jgi:hypothetical protein